MKTINPSDRAAVAGVIDPDAYSTGTQTTGWIDMGKFAAIMAIVQAGTLGASATIDAKLEQAQDSSGSGAKDVSDALEGIGRTLDGVPETAGLDEIVRLATTYRQWALDHPERYAILAAAVSPDGASRIRSSRAFERLVDAVRRVARAGAIVGDDHDAIADALWGFCHGMVTLELAGYHPDSAAAAARFMRGGMALLRGFSG